MLPDFPKSRRDLERQQQLYIHLRAQRNSPLGALSASVVQHEGTLHSYDQVTKTGTRVITEGFNEVRIPVKVEIAEIPNLVGETVKKRLDELSDEIARRNSQMFFKKLEAVTEEAGTSVHAGGQPVTKEMWLEMFQSMSVDFDPKTKKPELTIVAHPVTAEAMQKYWAEWELDREFMKTYKELFARKYEEWRDRESRRKLVD